MVESHQTGSEPDKASVAGRAAASGWVNEVDGLAEAAAGWQRAFAHQLARVPAQAVELSQAGPVDARRVARHMSAAAISRVVRTTTALPGAVLSGAPLRDPQGWAQRAAVEAFVDQLALGGAASAEQARLLCNAGALFPEVLRTELARRDIRPVDVSHGDVQRIANRALGGLIIDRSRPVTATPVSSLHRARTQADESVLVRIRRPGVSRDLRSDSALSAGLARSLEQLVPALGAMPALDFVQLTLRQTLEESDLRFEALGLLELGLAAEAAGAEGLVVARPRPDAVSERAVVIEDLGGVSLRQWRRRHGAVPDPVGALQGIAAITIESALVHGTFWADPAPEHLVVLDDGRVALVGAAVVGRLSPQLRLAGITVLKALVSGDAAGIVDAMRIAGALPDDVDPDVVIAALDASDQLDPMKILMGGEAGLLGAIREAVQIMVGERLKPPLEVTLLLRSVFALGALADHLDPEGSGGLAMALLPLLPKLPDLIAQAEAALTD
jgi:ubiquinone biosynthesis protein